MAQQLRRRPQAQFFEYGVHQGGLLVCGEVAVGVAQFGLEEEGQVRLAKFFQMGLLGQGFHLSAPLCLGFVQACLHSRGELLQVNLPKELYSRGLVDAEVLQPLGGFLLAGLDGQAQGVYGFEGVQPEGFPVGGVFLMGQQALQLMPRKVPGLVHDGEVVLQEGDGEVLLS